MATSSNQALTDEFAAFQDRVRTLALAIVHSIVRSELQQRVFTLKRSMVAKPVRTVKPPATAKPQVLVARLNAKRVWTRDAIVNELTTWLASGTSIDASFVKRYGPPGLVAATKRIFGRFDAALNVAALQVSKMYPDGPPTR